jgi:predicted phage tail protein
VAWSNVAGETGYRLERSLEGITWTVVTTTGADVTAYSNSGLLPATTYHYRVVAFNSGGDSPSSAVASATTPGDADTTPPSAPGGLKATVAKGKVNLSWSGSTDTGGSGLAGYHVWRSTGGPSSTFTVIATIGSTSYSDTAITGNVDYWYYVTAVDGAGNQSQPSNIVAVKSR